MLFRNVFLASLANYALADTEEAVITGTTKNWDSLLAENKDGLLAEFYAPWCGHCKKIAPEYEKAAQQLAADGSNVKLVKIDATVESSLATKHGVNGYPTLKWFVGGEPMDYDGPREAAGIVNWIKSMSGPSVIEEAPTGTEAFTVTWYAPEVGFFEDVAKVNRKKASWHFVKTEGTGKLVLQHSKESAVEVECADKAAIEVAFNDNQFPLYGVLDGESFGRYLSSNSGMVWTMLEMKEGNVDEVVEGSREMMTNIAKEVGTGDSKYKVAWTNTVEFKKVLEGMFGITEFPRVVVNTKMGDKKNYIYDGEMTQDKILNFINQVKAGEVQAHLKSEPTPENNDGPVKIVTGNTFEELVFTKDKDVLLEIYAPWCGHCKKLEPEYVKVAQKVVKEGFSDIITIAKLDGTLNDSPVDSISWSGFPTLVYVKAGSTEVTKYEDARDAKGIWKWIKNNHSQSDRLKEQLAKNQEARKKKPAEEKKEEL